MTQFNDERADKIASDGDGQDSDYDGAWKDALRSHLQESMEVCFPGIAKLID